MDWGAMSASWLKWEREIEATHEVVLNGLLARADLQPGEAVLDIGCGSGASTLQILAAVGPEADVLALDIAPPMAKRTAQRTGGRARVEVGDAQDHRFEPAVFDAVISQFGLMFFADTGAAFGNIRRAVRPGGRFHFVAWARPAKNEWFALSGRIAAARLGAEALTDPIAPGPFAFADAGRVLALLEGAGWQAEVETVAFEMLPQGTPEEIARMHLERGAAARMLRARGGTEADRAAIAEELRAGFAALMRDGQVYVPTEVHYFSARAPG